MAQELVAVSLEGKYEGSKLQRVPVELNRVEEFKGAKNEDMGLGASYVADATCQLLVDNGISGNTRAAAQFLQVAYGAANASVAGGIGEIGMYSKEMYNYLLGKDGENLLCEYLQPAGLRYAKTFPTEANERAAETEHSSLRKATTWPGTPSPTFSAHDKAFRRAAMFPPGETLGVSVPHPGGIIAVLIFIAAGVIALDYCSHGTVRRKLLRW